MSSTAASTSYLRERPPILAFGDGETPTITSLRTARLHMDADVVSGIAIAAKYAFERFQTAVAAVVHERSTTCSSRPWRDTKLLHSDQSAR